MASLLPQRKLVMLVVSTKDGFEAVCFHQTHSGALRTQKLRSPLLKTRKWHYVLLLEPGVGQNRSMRASPTARNVFLVLISTFPVPSPLFFQILTLLIFEMRYFWLSQSLMMMSWCLMSSDVSWHIRDKLWPMPKHGSIILYVHGNQKAR